MPTKKQHYIPRMLLKRFTIFRVPMKKPLIYQYDKDKNIERLVDISDICRKNNLYEIKNESGIISDKEINLIENRFSRLESVWNKIIDKIEQRKAVTQEDRCMLGVLLILQFMRMPDMIQFTSEWLYDISMRINKPLTKNEADRVMKLATFIWGDVEPETNWILSILIDNILGGKDVAIYHSEYDFILNGERPVLCMKLCEISNFNNSIWILPIAKNYCIGLVDKEATLYMDIDKELTEFINTQNGQNDGRFIYGSKSDLSRYVKNGHF